MFVMSQWETKIREGRKADATEGRGERIWREVHVREEYDVRERVPDEEDVYDVRGEPVRREGR